MSVQGVPIDEVLAKDFIMVRAALVKRLGGANEAIVWARIHYRCDEDSRVAHDHDGARWWAAAYPALAAETGLSEKQVRTATDRLVTGGFLLAEQHRLTSNYDQTFSYRPVVLGGQVDLPSGADESARVGSSDLPSGADVPSYSDAGTEVETSDAGGADFSPEVIALCSLVAELVRANGHKVGTVGKTWWSACDRMLRLDDYTPEQVATLARWATSHEFWAANIRSMPTLREKASTLRLQRNAELAKRRGRSTVQHGREVHEILAAREGEQLAVTA